MATIKQRNKTYYVIYSFHDKNGQKKQKWESYNTISEAKKRKKEVESKGFDYSFNIPVCKTLNQLLDEYIELYGKTKWAISTYGSNVALIEHYIRPYLGESLLTDLNPRVLERYYQQLLRTKAVPNNARHPKPRLISAHMVNEIHKTLRSCFNQAIKWELMEKNPASKATTPSVIHKRREIWTAKTLFRALNVCDDPRLALALNLSFCCSLRIGEMLGLTWDCIDISPESIEHGMAYVEVTKELQRVSRKALEQLDKKDVHEVIPAYLPTSSTVLVLKKPKTDSSIRKVFMPKAVAKMLVSWKALQDKHKYEVGKQYTDFNLVFASELGYPVESSTIRKSLDRLIKENDLPRVVFHSFRHSSVTYKLKLNGGDIKAVQGDTGHAQAKMVTEAYSHILDDSRQHNAELFQSAFYEKYIPAENDAPVENDLPVENDILAEDNIPTKLETPPAPDLPEGITQEALSKLLANPDIVQMLGQLAKKL